MFGWSITALVVAILAALLGFGGLATGTLALFSRMVFLLGFILFLAFLVQRRTPPVR
ncbi:MAG: DUF1328 domain-containing protein [Gammaproteobacteria bacterium]|nr:DUF1328 domain-containing protein [Gammaproteobacteria bacterium]